MVKAKTEKRETNKVLGKAKKGARKGQDGNSRTAFGLTNVTRSLTARYAFGKDGVKQGKAETV
ncbi:hypothetical protein TUM3792_16320 [Shewanella sp. MBTL60-007]|nr:hypothetical protein TUM3792_16320 [Shewanella sp. MBTL60-007]